MAKKKYVPIEEMEVKRMVGDKIVTSEEINKLFKEKFENKTLMVHVDDEGHWHIAGVRTA